MGILAARRCILLKVLLNLSLLLALAPQAEPAMAAGNYKLPLAPATDIWVGQGNSTGPTHWPGTPDEFAFDFVLNVGTPIYASRAGYVRMTKSNSNEGGCDPYYYDKANYIVIEHQDDLIGTPNGQASLYLHLEFNGIEVSTGQFVRQGQRIGRSGGTGYICPNVLGIGPHLHFSAQDYAVSTPFTQSRPIMFADHRHELQHGVPSSWQFVRSRNYDDLGEAIDWFFAEGYTGNGFDEYLSILNPHSNFGATITITYYISGESPQARNLIVGPRRRYTVIVHEAAQGIGRGKAVATRVQSTNGVPIIVERPMYFVYSSVYTGTVDGGHNAMGVTPRELVGNNVWWFSEGWTGTGSPPGTGFDEYITIQNPHGLDGVALLTYMLASGGTISKSVPVPAQQRATVVVRDHVGSNQAVGLKVDARYLYDWSLPLPMDVERPMYFNFYSPRTGIASGGHTTAGAVNPEYSWYFSEGTTRPGFETFFTVLNPGNTGPRNPNNQTANVSVTYYLSDGSQIGPVTYPVLPQRRFTIDPRWISTMDNKDFATKIEANFPIVAERPMYFLYGPGWTGGHVSVGIPKPEYTFYFAEGWTGSGFDEFLALYNAHRDTWAYVTVEYIYAGGGGITKYYSVLPRQRLTLNVRAEINNEIREVSMKVTSQFAPIVAERPMYFNYVSSTFTANGGHVVVGYSP